MGGSFITFFIFAFGAVAAWVLNNQYGEDYLHGLFITFVILAVSYFILRLVPTLIARTRVTEPRMKFAIRKVTSVLFLIVAAAAVLLVWVQDVQTLIVTYGLLAAGGALALQDLFKDFIGGFAILSTGRFRIGDRVQIDDVSGDIVDIGLLFTTMMEIGGWINGDQTTGRIVTIPNSKVMTSRVQNYTKDHKFLWDEIFIPLTYDSDWKKARTEFLEIADEVTEQISEKAEKDLRRLGYRYYYLQRHTEPMAKTLVTDNWIDLRIRYVTNVRDRRNTKQLILERVLELISENKKYKIASTTLDIIGAPELNIRKKK